MLHFKDLLQKIAPPQLSISLRKLADMLDVKPPISLRQVIEEGARYARLPPPQTAEYIRKFAPEVRIHPEEQYLPSSIEWYLRRIIMRFNVKGGSDDAILGKGQVNLENIANQSNHGQISGASYPSDFFLQIPNDSDEENTRHGSLDSAICYVRTLPYTDYADIQYWFFYPYNGDITPGPLNFAHEGDFEHITVRVSYNGEMVQAFYAAHDKEGQWHSPKDITMNSAGRPVVYSAKSSHASYPTSGEQKRKSIFPNDYTANGGLVWNTQQNLLRISETQPNWIKFSGMWGEIGIMDFTTGPRGPAFQSAWNGDDNF